MDLSKFNTKAKSQARENKKFLNRLKKYDPKKLDHQFHYLHEEVFSEIDCLTCANCCKTTSPVFYPSDIDRAAGALKLRPGNFIETFLRIDEDNDYVLKSVPCPFLANDNTCKIYADRPRACRDYPHTNRKKMNQLLDLTYKNSLVCPAVLEIINRMKRMK